MFKNLKKSINEINARNRRGSKADSDGTNNDQEGEAAQQAAPAPPNVAVGPKAVPPPGGPPGKVPPGVIVKGAPPPGAKIIKGPPPGEAMKVMASGAGSVTPPRPGAVSPPTNSAGGSPPLGSMKVIGHPPPGAKIVAGAPPPPGMKVIAGSPPPGAKIVHGAPPPGAKVVHGAPPPGAKVMPGTLPAVAVRPGSPSLVLGPGSTPPRVVPSPPPGALVKSPSSTPLPPGAKLLHGPPPPGSRPLSPENLRAMTGTPTLIPSRSVSPTNPPVYRVLPNGVKVIAGPPPANALVKQAVKAPPSGTTSPTPPAKSPPKKMLIKSMVAVPGSRAQSPNSSQVIPHNSSFSVGPAPGTPPATQNLPRPTPVRPAGGTVVKAQPPQPAPSVPSTISSLSVPQPKVIRSRSGSQQDELHFEEEDGEAADASDGDDIHFEEGRSATPPQAPREAAAPPPPAPMARSAASSAASSSSASTFSIKQDPDEATALPPARKSKDVVANAAPSSVASVQSSQQSKPVSEPKEKTRRRTHRTTSDAPRERGKHRHRHRRHRSRSSDDGSSSQQSYRVPKESTAAAAAVPAVAATVEGQLRPRSSPPARVSSPQQQQIEERAEEIEEPQRQFGVPLSEAAFTPSTLTSTSRNRIAEDFLSMLCPQQYYGKVKKINRIRPFKANRAAASGLRSSNTIYVATKGTIPNPYFYPQLRLRDTDGEQPTGLSGDDTVDGAVDTPIILYEAAPGNMLFAETELDARRLLETSPSANSCFMLNNSAILFKDPEHYVLPIASLNVHWVPYSSPQSEPQCPIHRRELQLFDPYSKELVCALCASRNGVPMANFVVIPDVLGNAESRHTIQEKVSSQLDEAQQSARRWVEQHQRVRELCENKKTAIRNQFDLLIEALEAKKHEYTEACEAEFAYAQTDVAREILITDEKVQLLKAATDHLRTDSSRPLFSMQIATIAEGLSAAADLPSRFTRNSLQLPPMSSGLVPNLEGVMAQVLELSPSAGVSGPRAASSGSRSRPRANSHSPYNSQHVSVLNNTQRPVDDSVVLSGGGARRRSGQRASVAAAAAIQNASRSASANNIKLQASPLRTPPSYTFPPSPNAAAAGARDESSRLSTASSAQKRSANGVGSASPYATDAVSVPNSTGTSLFDFALHDLLSTFDASNVKKRSPRYIQWAIRVEDPGDWVGLGVGVGSTIDAWEQGSTNDLSHLWIVPASMTGQVLHLRVTVQPSSGHARLTVHDVRGKQLDAGEVPQWNSARPSYPQATFGGHVGTVRMIEVPHAVR